MDVHTYGGAALRRIGHGAGNDGAQDSVDRGVDDDRFVVGLGSCVCLSEIPASVLQLVQGDRPVGEALRPIQPQDHLQAVGKGGRRPVSRRYDIAGHGAAGGRYSGDRIRAHADSGAV